VFHAELYTRIRQARAFNLDADQVQRQFVIPMLSRELFVYQGREWDPRKAKLKIYEAPELRPDEIGMGRGWPTVQKIGTDVTAEMQAQALAQTQPPATTPAGALRLPVVDQLKERLIGRLSAGPVTLAEITAMAADLMPGSDPAEQLAASHRAAAELLQSGGARLAPPSPLI
jgi:hypothetical protein